MAVIKFKKIIYLIGLLLIFPVSPAYAEDYAVAQTYIHAFSNNISVYTGVFALNKDVSLNTSVYGKYTVDMINPNFFEEGGEGGEGAGKRRADKAFVAVSGASTAAGGSSGASDTRNNLTAGVTHNFDNIVTIEAGYDYSSEKDYISNTPGITFKKDLFQKNTTLTVGYSKNIDNVNGKFMASTDKKNTNNYYVGLTQIITPKTIAQFGYSKNEANGFMPEGNRLVPVDGVDAATCTDTSITNCLPEKFPNTRLREAYILGVNHYMLNGIIYPPAPSSIRLTLRQYKDDWDISSYTEEIEYYQYLPEQNLLRLNFRNYQQTKAYFVKSVHSSTDQYLSISPQLEAMQTYLIGVKLSHAFDDDPDYGIFANSFIEGGYEYYLQSTETSAHNFTLGVKFLF